MARAAVCEDVFNAIAEKRRRAIITLLQSSPCTVGKLADKLGMRQPAISKHLGVLRKVGVVTVIRDGRHRFYKLDARKLKPVHDWVRDYERFWNNQLVRIKVRAEKTTQEND